MEMDMEGGIEAGATCAGNSQNLSIVGRSHNLEDRRSARAILWNDEYHGAYFDSVRGVKATQHVAFTSQLSAGYSTELLIL